jgi:AraC-like DNA-binding protein
MNTKKIFRLVPVSEEQKQWGIYLTNCGYEKVGAGFQEYPLKNTPRRYRFNWETGRLIDEFSLVYVEEGRGVYSSEREAERFVEAGDVWWTFPGLRDRYRPDVKTGWKVYWVAFQGEAITRVFKKFFSDEDTILHLQRPLEFELAIKAFVEEVLESPMDYPFSTGAKILNLVGRLLELKENKEGTPHDQSIRRVQSHILNHAFTDIDYPALCKPFGFSESTLRRSFLKLTQMTPLQFQRSIRLKYACEMLIGSELSVGEIGQKVGFTDCNYFTRVFTKHYGCSPKSYREQTVTRTKNPEI